MTHSERAAQSRKNWQCASFRTRVLASRQHFFGTYVDRFWRSIHKTSTCWLWQGAVGSTGYGVLTIEKRQHYAHRLSWEMHYGRIPDDKIICHHCDTPLCVNPTHLFLGVQADNIHDALRKGRMRHGSLHPNAVLDEQQIQTILQSTLSSRQLAKLYHVSKTTILNIRNRVSWRHVTLKE